MADDEARADALQEQHKRRMASMPYLYFAAPPAVAAWARPWQQRIHEALRAVERVELHPDCFVAPGARLFAEPNREVRLGARSAVAEGATVHGPVMLEEDVSVGPSSILDGGRRGIHVGAGTRISSHVSIYAFDHGMALGQPIHAQPVRSRGIRIASDVWIGTHATVTDGVRIERGAVIAAGAVVTRDVAAEVIAAGVPARVIGMRTEGEPSFRT